MLDHVIILNERHLWRLMREYVRYYHNDRTHLTLGKGTSAGRAVEKNAFKASYKMAVSFIIEADIA